MLVVIQFVKKNFKHVRVAKALFSWLKILQI
jgi:hypothetical protein